MSSIQTRQLSATNPLSYLRLLYWVFFQPTKLDQTLVDEHAVKQVGAWLVASLFACPWLIYSVSKFSDGSGQWLLGIVLIVWIVFGIVANEGDESKFALLLYGISILSFFGLLLWVFVPAFQQNNVLGVLIYIGYIITHAALMWIAHRTAGILAFTVTALQVIMSILMVSMYAIWAYPRDLLEAVLRRGEWNLGTLIGSLFLLTLLTAHLYFIVRKQPLGLLNATTNVLAAIIHVTSNILRQEIITLPKLSLLLILVAGVVMFYGCFTYACWAMRLS